MDYIESLCGSQLWDNTTLYSEYPDFTFCFHHTLLIWIPCLLVWIGSPVWIFMLTRQVTPKLGYSWVFIFKIVSDSPSIFLTVFLEFLILF